MIDWAAVEGLYGNPNIEDGAYFAIEYKDGSREILDWEDYRDLMPGWLTYLEAQDV